MRPCEVTNEIDQHRGHHHYSPMTGGIVTLEHQCSQVALDELLLPLSSRVLRTGHASEGGGMVSTVLIRTRDCDTHYIILPISRYIMVAEERVQASYVGWIAKMNAEEIQYGLAVRNRTFQVI